eukprot:TRINITY_DN1596_c0_g1_i3.p2 TRINITY_DN1596_c0_g1~~TRINITY_DN1596_c0_g1_i3.p2  ORF type:complete len:161 (+),score=51.84 TRINITY_DN1596_c0_g1_i3:72-554(+)
MWVPGAEALKEEAAVDTLVDYTTVAPTHTEAHRPSTLFAALTASLDHVQSRRYGATHAAHLAPYLRHDIEEAFDSAMASTFHSREQGDFRTRLPDLELEEVRGIATEDGAGPFPLFRRGEGDRWTMVVQNAKVTHKDPPQADRHVVADFLKLELTDGRER